MKTLLEVWTNDLPVSFQKLKAIKMLESHWGLSQNATYNKIRQGKFTVSDARFFYEKLCIASDCQHGFFFDSDKYATEQNNESEAFARKLGLVSA